jgi:hypothetical protein
MWDVADRALTEGVPTSSPRRLDDENPVIPLAVDVDGDVAVVTLLSWSEQNSGWEPSLWDATLVGHDGDWYRAFASGGLPPRDYPLAARRPADPAGLHIRVYGAGPQQSLSGDKSWLSAAIHVTAEVETVRRRARPASTLPRLSAGRCARPGTSCRRGDRRRRVRARNDRPAPRTFRLLP